MKPLTQMICCGLLEKDPNGYNSWTWVFPSVNKGQKVHAIKKCNSQSDECNGQSFVFARHNNEWFYIYCIDILENNRLPKVKQVATVIFSKEFNPQKYEVLCRIFSKAYCKSGSPVEVFKFFLTAYTRGLCALAENGSFYSEEIDSYSSGSNGIVRELIKTFELETILIYTALLLKKRIVVYHHTVEQLVRWVQALPALMIHHDVLLYLHPWIDLGEDDIMELIKRKHFVLGSRDSSVTSRLDLYDVLVNIPAREITVASHAKEFLTMTKTHKEIALFMVQLSENQSYTETQIITEIAEKTRDLINQLTAIAHSEVPGKGKTISRNTIKEKNLAPAVENFLINLAAAENIPIVG